MIFILEVMYPSNMRITSRFQMRSASSKLFSNWHSIIKCILSDSIEWKLIILGSQESNNSSPISTKVIDYEIPFQWLKRRINERRVQNKRSTSRVLITVPKKKKGNYRKIQRWPQLRARWSPIFIRYGSSLLDEESLESRVR